MTTTPINILHLVPRPDRRHNDSVAQRKAWATRPEHRAPLGERRAALELAS